jgi:hypothetical protein
MRQTIVIALLALCGSISTARAGLYTDDMTRCLVEASSKEDKATLVRWIFVALSQNPSISSLSTATEADIDKSNAATGALFMRLLTDACVDRVKKVIKYEGPVAIQSSFEVLGRVATSELFSDPKVSAVMAGLEKHVDKKKIEALKDAGP